MSGSIPPSLPKKVVEGFSKLAKEKSGFEATAQKINALLKDKENTVWAKIAKIEKIPSTQNNAFIQIEKFYENRYQPILLSLTGQKGMHDALRALMPDTPIFNVYDLLLQAKMFEDWLQQDNNVQKAFDAVLTAGKGEGILQLIETCKDLKLAIPDFLTPAVQKGELNKVKLLLQARIPLSEKQKTELQKTSESVRQALSSEIPKKANPQEQIEELLHFTSIHEEDALHALKDAIQGRDEKLSVALRNLLMAGGITSEDIDEALKSIKPSENISPVIEKPVSAAPKAKPTDPLYKAIEGYDVKEIESLSKANWKLSDAHRESLVHANAIVSSAFSLKEIIKAKEDPIEQAKSNYQYIKDHQDEALKVLQRLIRENNKEAAKLILTVLDSVGAEVPEDIINKILS